MTIGQRIQQARKKAGLSQKQLGEKLGLSASMIGQWENDLRKPKYETIGRILGALGISFPDLMGIERDNDGGWKIVYEEEHINEIDNFIRSYDGCIRVETAMALMTEEGQSKVADYAEDILPRYRRQDAPEPPAGTNTTPPPDTAERPEKPEEGG